MRILIIGGISRSLVNFRGPLIKAMLAEGHEVIACAGEPHADVAETLKSWGVAFFPINLARAGMSPFGDLRTCLQLRRLMREQRPDAILAYTIKPVIWGGMAYRFSGCKGTFFALITGLGMAFQPGEFKKGLLTKLVTFLYRTALTHAEKVIFQNEDNRDVFVNRKIVPRNKTFVVSGSGVDLEQFLVHPLPDGSLTFLTIARLLGDKGLRELRQAAAILGGQKPDDRGRKAGGPPAVQLLGPEDSSPDGIPLPEVQGWHDAGDLNYLGATNDVRPFIAGCHVYVLPSYHEGMPRTVLEAMAMGRPIITTDAPGCRETVRGRDAYRDEGGNLRAESNSGNTTHQNGETTEGRPAFANSTAGKPQTADSPLTPYPLPLTSTKLRFGLNGILIPPRDPEALAEAMRFFIDHPEEITIMGRESRRYAEERYDVHKVNAVMLREMGMMGEDRRL